MADPTAENKDVQGATPAQKSKALSREERFRVNFDGVDERARAESIATGANHQGATAILLVSHGSHSPTWRHMLLDVHRDVADDLLKLPDVTQVRSAFMEYTEPSIATQLRAFDDAGIEEVIVVSLLLTISDHSFDDIPVICGQRDDLEKAAELAEEKIEIYTPTARLTFTPLLDFTALVEQNLARRVAAAVGSPDEIAATGLDTALVLIGYGSADFDDQWHEFFGRIEEYAVAELGVSEAVHAWCGHLVSYSRQPTLDALEHMLAKHERVVLVPIFVAYDEMFHEKIMGRAAERCSAPDRVIYTNDSVLPEPAVAVWIREIADQTLASSVHD